MSVTTVLKDVEYPNFDLLDYFDLIEDVDRRVQIVLDIGHGLRRQGVPSKLITKSLVQLATETKVRVETIDADTISKLLERGRSVNEEECLPCDDITPDSSSEAESQVEELQESSVINELKENGGTIGDEAAVVCTPKENFKPSIEENIENKIKNKSQTIQNNNGDDTSHKDNKAIKEKTEQINANEKKSVPVVEKPQINNLQDSNKVSNVLCKNVPDTSFNKHEAKKEISSKIECVPEVTKTSTTEIKPINRKELICMLHLKEKIAQNLSKKNIHLPSSSTNNLPDDTREESRPTVSASSGLENTLDQVNDQLHNIETIVESRKRHVQDAEAKIKNKKKRTISEQKTLTKVQEIQNQTKNSVVTSSFKKNMGNKDKKSHLSSKTSSENNRGSLIVSENNLEGVASRVTPQRSQSIVSRVSDNNSILKDILSTEAKTGPGIINALTKSKPPIENPKNVNSHITSNTERIDSSIPVENRLVPESSNDQNFPYPQTRSGTDASSHLTKETTLPQECPTKRFVEKVLESFWMYLKKYWVSLSCPSKRFDREFIKCFVMSYMDIFKDDDMSKKINKIAELLHLSLSDLVQRDERSKEALKLQSEGVRNEEIKRANQDYEEILPFRGGQLADMLLSVLPKINLIKDEDIMLETFYLKLTLALTSIDVGNANHIYDLKDLVTALLKSANQPVLLNRWKVLEVDTTELKNKYVFVKQLLMAIYQSGYHDAETENFWKFFSFEPVIPNLEVVSQKPSLQTHHPQNMRSSVITNHAVKSQTPTTFGSHHPVNKLKESTYQIPLNILQQKVADIRSNPYMFMNQTEIAQKSLVQNRMQNTQEHRPQISTHLEAIRNTPQEQIFQRSTQTFGARNPAQLPPFATLNHRQVVFQPSNQAQQGRCAYYPMSSRPSAPTQAQTSSYFVTNPPTTLGRPPAPYQAATTQLWEPRASNNVTAAIHIRIPESSRKDIVSTDFQNVTVPSTHRLVQVCWMSGCSKTATVVCSRCREAVYCSTDCQGKDWCVKHRGICKR